MLEKEVKVNEEQLSEENELVELARMKGWEVEDREGYEYIEFTKQH